MTVVIIPIQIAAYVIVPPPTTTRGFFRLFQDNALLALVALDLLLINDMVLLSLILLALYIALRRVKPSVMKNTLRTSSKAATTQDGTALRDPDQFHQ